MRSRIPPVILIGLISLGLAYFGHRAHGQAAAGEPAIAPLAATHLQAQPPQAWWIALSLPLELATAIPDAETLAQQIPGAREVLHWNASLQSFDSWVPDSVFPPPGGYGINYPVELGGVYFVLATSSMPSLLDIQGAVPALGTYSFDLLGNSQECLWNPITVPFGANVVPNAQGLADTFDIGNARRVAYWSAIDQAFILWTPLNEFPPPGGRGTNFQVLEGSPYFVCLGTNESWP